MSLYKARILYEKGVIPKLAKYFGVSEHTVRNALRFVTEGEQPEAIRNEALKNYGCALVKKPLNEPDPPKYRSYRNVDG